jgi:hypothetical protein
MTARIGEIRKRGRPQKISTDHAEEKLKTKGIRNRHRVARGQKE